MPKSLFIVRFFCSQSQKSQALLLYALWSHGKLNLYVFFECIWMFQAVQQRITNNWNKWHIFLFALKWSWNSLKHDNANISSTISMQLQPHFLLLGAWMLFSRLLYYHMTEWTYGYSIVNVIVTEVSHHVPCRAINHVENQARACFYWHGD